MRQTIGKLCDSKIGTNRNCPGAAEMKIGMRNVRKLVACLVLLLLFCVSSDNSFGQSGGKGEPALHVVEAGPFRIHVHVENKEVAAMVKRAGEQTWGIASGLYGSEMPQEKMDVHLYRNVEGYLAADEKLTKGKFKRNQAFAHFKTLSAHVTLQPPISDELLKEIGLPKQSARLLAHEMAHLVRFDRMLNTFRDHPYWLIDGVASVVDQRVLVAIDYMDAPMDDPNFGSYTSQGKQLLEDGNLPTAEKLLDDEKLEVGFYRSYAVRWLFVDMLMTQHPEKFQSFLKDLRRIGGGKGYATRSKKLLLKHLAVNVETLNLQFRDHVKKLKPQWIEQGRSFETMGSVWDQISFPNSTATSWRQATLNESFTISSAVTIHEVGRNQLNIRIGQPDSFTQFSITAGYGLNVFEFADKSWETKLAKKIDGIETGKSLKLELSYDAEQKEAVLKLDGAEIFQGSIDPGSESRVALGVQKGSAVSWKSFEVK
jgi:hypothetical protein